MRRRSASDRATGPHRRAGRGGTGSGGDSAAGVSRRAGRPCLFEHVVGCRFPMLGNLFGTMDRVRYIFRHSLKRLEQLVALQVDPADLMRRPRLYWRAPWTALLTRPRKVRTGPVLAREITVEPTAAVEVVAGRRRGLHHAAAGLYRGPRPAGPGPRQPGHVSRAAFGRAVRARTARWGCTTRFSVASPPITPRRCGAARRCG